MSAEVALVGSKRRSKGRSPDDRRSLGEMILAGRNRGERMHALARHFGIDEVTASNYMKLALEARIPPTVDEFRRQQNDVLDERTTMLQQQLDACTAALMADDLTEARMGTMMTLRLSTITTMLRVDERRAKLNGLDAPMRVEAVLVEHQDEDEKVAALIENSRERLAATRAQA